MRRLGPFFLLLSGCALVGGVDDDYRLGATTTSTTSADGGNGAAGGSVGGAAGSGGVAVTGGGGTGTGGSGGYRVFLTSAVNDGQFGPDPGQALMAMDGVCKDAAESRSLGGAWVAWVTSSARPNMSGMLGAGGPWRQVQSQGNPDPGALIALDYFDLTSPPLDQGIQRDEAGTLVPDGSWVYTGTNASGSSTSTNCIDWTSTGTVGTMGFSGHTDAGWTDQDGSGCAQVAHHLYCFELPF
jgi:hypothetical protein